ncbi:E3 ubiquitin-protein ligase TRIM45-like [Saccostrea echinata]|uniref:E3 ubiquitin-protein ligase TRIM45-like n=1 Tax=Saccostrea echinata TaxID=191078 RepID=UPI002A800DD8|nr:E3 ubiquitin-protein ligase TRIM45-like [Saccostrea echinata]
MALERSFAQHFAECENCEENPAQFLCKTCPGHLCETCKREHETRKITKNHEVIHIHLDRENTLGLLYCAEHTVNKVEWYCSPCKEPVCTKCLMESHNGHRMKELDKVLKEIGKKLEEEKGQVERILLPKYREMLSEVKTTKSEISIRAEEVRKQIEGHEKSIIEQVTMMKENVLQNLLEGEKKAIISMEKSENEIESRIEKLLKINEVITSNLRANPGITFFKNTDFKALQEMHQFPTKVFFKLDNFQPGDPFSSERHFGKSPEFTIYHQPRLQSEDVIKETIITDLFNKISLLESQIETERNVLTRSSLRRQLNRQKEELSKIL